LVEEVLRRGHLGVLRKEGGTLGKRSGIVAEGRLGRIELETIGAGKIGMPRSLWEGCRDWGLGDDIRRGRVGGRRRLGRLDADDCGKQG
jgi:hypothetical protein